MQGTNWNIEDWKNLEKKLALVNDSAKVISCFIEKYCPDGWKAMGASGYYIFNNGEWDGWGSLPTGYTPVYLSDFQEGEIKGWKLNQDVPEERYSKDEELTLSAGYYWYQTGKRPLPESILRTIASPIYEQVRKEEDLRQDFIDWWKDVKGSNGGYEPLAMQIFYWFESRADRLSNSSEKKQSNQLK